MKTSLYTVTVPVFIKNLKTLKALLQKAETHEDAEALLQKQLIADQFPLIRQVQIACDNAKAYAFRLNGENPPVHEDNQTTFAELYERIDSVVTILEGITPDQVDGHEDAQVRMKYFEGKRFSGFAYTTEYLMPNFFFHVVTAYSILRHAGVQIGKNDYIGGLPLEDDV